MRRRKLSTGKKLLGGDIERERPTTHNNRPWIWKQSHRLTQVNFTEGDKEQLAARDSEGESRHIQDRKSVV